MACFASYLDGFTPYIELSAVICGTCRLQVGCLEGLREGADDVAECRGLITGRLSP